jgi:hypothetical protein
MMQGLFCIPFCIRTIGLSPRPHSVADLVALPDHLYRPPRLPAAVAAHYPDTAALEDVHPGTPAAAKLFLLDLDAWTFVNHGAFGGAFACGMRVAEAWRSVCEQQPLKFFDRLLPSSLPPPPQPIAAL